MRRSAFRPRLEALESRRLLSVTADPVFSDEFNQPAGSLPNPGTWRYDLGWDPNAAVHYIDDSSVLSVVNDAAAADGKALAIKILRGPDDSHGHPTFLSGRINTSIDPVGDNLQYGRVEARLKMPGGPNGQGNGLWPAFWMLGSNFPQVGWPNCGEIDIMENRGTTPGTTQGSLHAGAYYGPRMDPTSFYNLPAGQAFYSSYHVFAVDWSPGSIRFSVDGQVYSSFQASSYSPAVWKFDGHPFYVIFNIADGGAFGGALGPNSTFPQTMYVDYVRAYGLTGIDTPTNLTARGVTTNQVNLSWQDSSSDATGFLLQRSTAPDFSTIDTSFNLAQGTSTFQDTTAAPGTAYYYRLQAVASDGTLSYQSDFTDPATATTWLDQDVNATGGSGAFAGGTFTLVGRGGDIGGGSDQLNFLSAPVTGDSVLFGRLTGLTNTSPSAKAGLMARNSSAPDSAFADVVATPGSGVSFQWRAADGGVASSASAAGVRAPVWLRLVRTGNGLSGFYSTDDVNWTQVGTTQSVALNVTALDGLAVASNNPSAAATATLTNVSAGPYVPPAVVALNCGGTGQGEFAADAYFSATGTLTSHSSAAVDTTGVPDPAPQSVYDSDRYGNHFTYTIPNLTPGSTYDVQLQFAENYWTSAGKRIFNVAINGASALSSFDIFATAGGAHKAVQEDFPAVADAGGTVTLSFTTSKDNAQINGIRIISRLAAPTGLAATAVSSSEIDLSWVAPASGDVLGYNVYRGTSAGGESSTPLNTTPLTDTSYQDTAVAPATAYYYVVTAVYASGSSGASNEASATTQGVTGADLALYHPAYASSLENASFPASNAFDGDSTTRWSSQFSDPQWIYVDLGAGYNITEVSLNWQHAAGRDYQIQVSDDAASWTTIQSVTGNTTFGVHDYPGLSGAGRYVRVFGTARATQYGYSLFDFNVYGTPE
jgi:beta-glucanase (GH16 family)